MMFLIYVNQLGPNYKGENIYEFIFTDDIKDVWGESWESKPANGYPYPPDIIFIKKVGLIKNNDVTLSVVQESDYFSMLDAIDNVIALAWEDENDFIDFEKTKRLVFQYGESYESVENKLYERDIKLQTEKKFNYE